MRNIATTAAIAAGALALAGCGAAISKTPAAPATSAAAAQAASASAPAPSPSSSAPLSGPAGTTFTVTASDGSSYDVTLDKVSQSVYPGAYETPQNPGDHYAAAQFTITGDSGNTSDDANSDAAAIGSDGQQYSYADADSLPDFSYGEFHVGPGVSVKGWVVFELPAGVTVASVQWAPSFNGSAATWNLGG